MTNTILLPTQNKSALNFSYLSSFECHPENLTKIFPTDHYRIYLAFRDFRTNVEAIVRASNYDLPAACDLACIFRTQLAYILQSIGFVWNQTVSAYGECPAHHSIESWYEALNQSNNVYEFEEADKDAAVILMPQYQNEFNLVVKSIFGLEELYTLGQDIEGESHDLALHIDYKIDMNRALNEIAKMLNILANCPIFRESGIRHIVKNTVANLNWELIDDFDDQTIELPIREVYVDNSFGFESTEDDSEEEYDDEEEIDEVEANKELLSQFVRPAVRQVANANGYTSSDGDVIEWLAIAMANDYETNFTDQLIGAEEEYQKSVEADSVKYELDIYNRQMSSINELLFQNEFEANCTYSISHATLVEMLGGSYPILGSHDTVTYRNMIATRLGVDPRHVNVAVTDGIVFTYIDTSKVETVELKPCQI